MRGVQKQTWALLVYTMPREPTAPRVAVWRKLKKLGALRLHDAAWALPATEALLEQVRWLAEEIREGAGEALVWQAQGDSSEQDDQLIAHFVAQAERSYQALLVALDAPAALADGRPDSPSLYDGAGGSRGANRCGECHLPCAQCRLRYQSRHRWCILAGTPGGAWATLAGGGKPEGHL
jgi:hypothetical protein